MKENGLRKTTHFDERWVERVGGDSPTVQEVSRILDNSILLQKPRDLFTPKGRPYRIMAMYWNPERQLVFKVDQRRKRLVTVLTPKILKKGKAKRKEYE